MANVKGANEGVEWRVKVSNFSSEILVTEPKHAGSFGVGLNGLFMSTVLGIQGFLKKAWDLAVDEPRKVMHCIKVGIALSVVSLFYYMRPLYDGVGGNAIWAVMTVVVVFEYTVGEYPKIFKINHNAHASKTADAYANACDNICRWNFV